MNTIFQNKEFIKLSKKSEKCKKNLCKKEYNKFHNNIDKKIKNVIQI